MVKRLGKGRSVWDEKIFILITIVIVVVSAIICLLPFLRVLSEAFSSDVYVTSGELWFWPRGFTLKQIKFILDTFQFRQSMFISILSTVTFTALAVVFTILLAYPISRRYLPGKNGMMFFVTFTMMFNGGIIPTYMVVKALGWTNTFWALIFPQVISAYNVLIMVTSFRAIPAEMEEAAWIEGAGNFTILFKIMVPLAKSTVAVILLYYAVARWNWWFDAIMYINKQSLFTLPVVIRQVIARGTSALAHSITTPPPTIAVQSAAVMFSIVPILILYPFLQKYFVKGVMLGGIKG
jgi:ABC-type glycerol-3-phosphate transport system permease component